MTSRAMVLIALMAAFAHAPAGAQQPAPSEMRQYLDQTRQLIREGRYDEGLDRMRWFREHALEYGSEMAGVRNSFALNDWKNLGDAYPPAMTALIETREATLARVRQSPTDLLLFSDLSALNRVLEEEHRTLEVYEMLALENPDAAKVHWNAVSEIVLEGRRFDLVGKYQIDLLQDFEREKQLYESLVALEERRSAEPRTPLLRVRNQRFVSHSLMLISAALALDQQTTARSIQERALAVIPDPTIRAAIP